MTELIEYLKMNQACHLVYRIDYDSQDLGRNQCELNLDLGHELNR